MSPTIDQAPPEELEDVRAGRLPARYGYRMQDVFLERLRPLLVPGVRILDLGAGRSPTLAPEDRPEGCYYVGLDISAEELEAAPPAAYDASYVHDIVEPLAELREFDVVISWQVLEHVSSLPQALANLRGTLQPGGTLLAQLSGTFAAFALASRVIPHRLRVEAMARYLGHAEELKFPTHFDHCYARAIKSLLREWGSGEIVSYYRGAPYFSMSRPLQRLYLGYENFIESRSISSLATHYLIIARAPWSP
jgi:2-polyprenyl-6-hydroxyphenyl methylase/3-demethylubiquinone-9 3-methyltransferase